MTGAGVGGSELSDDFYPIDSGLVPVSRWDNNCVGVSRPWFPDPARQLVCGGNVSRRNEHNSSPKRLDKFDPEIIRSCRGIHAFCRPHPVTDLEIGHPGGAALVEEFFCISERCNLVLQGQIGLNGVV